MYKQNQNRRKMSVPINGSSETENVLYKNRKDSGMFKQRFPLSHHTQQHLNNVLNPGCVASRNASKSLNSFKSKRHINVGVRDSRGGTRESVSMSTKRASLITKVGHVSVMDLRDLSRNLKTKVSLTAELSCMMAAARMQRSSHEAPSSNAIHSLRNRNGDVMNGSFKFRNNKSICPPPLPPSNTGLTPVGVGRVDQVTPFRHVGGASKLSIPRNKHVKRASLLDRSNVMVLACSATSLSTNRNEEDKHSSPNEDAQNMTTQCSCPHVVAKIKVTNCDLPLIRVKIIQTPHSSKNGGKTRIKEVKLNILTTTNMPQNVNERKETSGNTTLRSESCMRHNKDSVSMSHGRLGSCNHAPVYVRRKVTRPGEHTALFLNTTKTVHEKDSPRSVTSTGKIQSGFPSTVKKHAGKGRDSSERLQSPELPKAHKRCPVIKIFSEPVENPQLKLVPSSHDTTEVFEDSKVQENGEKKECYSSFLSVPRSEVFFEGRPRLLSE